jgi:hypothetical protein
VKRLLCWLFGHGEMRDWWGQWETNAEVGKHRVISTCCERCKGVLKIRSELWDEKWW